MDGNWPEASVKSQAVHSSSSPALFHFKSIQYMKIWIYKKKKMEGASLQKPSLLHVFDLSELV